MEMEVANNVGADQVAAKPCRKPNRRPRSFRIYFTNDEADQLAAAAQEHGMKTPKPFLEEVIRIALRDKLFAAIIDDDEGTGHD